ncbi:hypothetical protein ES706_00029 [subsurface metagenome]|nr:hypothetical protein [Hadesarchaea archaeon]
MTSIFISHSQKDVETLNYFNNLFGGTLIKAIRAEFERYERPPWTAIKNWVNESSAVFLLLGPNLRGSIFTSNWVSFEVGLACQARKSVWIFEQVKEPVDFPVPYLTNYMLYDPASRVSFERIQEIVQSYDSTPQLAGAALGALLGAAFVAVVAGKKGTIPGAFIGGVIGASLTRKTSYGIQIKCPHDDCGISFMLHTKVDNFLCPTCRRAIYIKE